jgi:hypothetical protein
VRSFARDGGAYVWVFVTFLLLAKGSRCRLRCINECCFITLFS